MTNLVTLQEKLRYLNDISRVSDLEVCCADKVKVKEYAKEVLGEDIGAPLLGVYNHFEDIDFDNLPQKFMLKCNHGCGMNIPCYDKKKFNYVDAKRKLNSWVSKQVGVKSQEYQYSKIDRKIFAEGLLTDNKDESLIDYRIWCFNGEVKFLGVNGGHGWGQIIFFDRDFKPIDLFTSPTVPKDYKKLYSNYTKPENFERMIDYAEKLAANFKFVRVDMYNINGKIYLGEMTFSPGGYTFHFKNHKGENLDKEIGALLSI